MSSALINLGWLLGAGLLAGAVAYGAVAAARFVFAETGLRRLMARLARCEPPLPGLSSLQWSRD
jgi:hypothetical protein